MESYGLKLQRLHDGELPADEAEALRRGLTDEDREKLLALAEIDQVVQHAVLAEAEQVDLWSGLEKRLPAAAPAKQRVSPLRRRIMLQGSAALATALAMAAAFAIWLKPAPTQINQTNHCDVVSLEVAGGAATVFKVPGEKGDETTVVWVDHQESDEWESL